MSRSLKRRGFTLVEILIVVVILGILAAIIVPLFTGASEDARRGAFVESLGGLKRAAELFAVRTGSYPLDTSSGAAPTDGFEDYIRVSQWTKVTPIGGVWDTELNDNGITAAIGVHFDGTGATRDDTYMTIVDEIMDDGDLSTGSFRKLADARYYWVCVD